MMKNLLAAVAAVALVGCSGSVNGTVGGVNLSVQDAIFSIIKDNQGRSIAAFIVMADKPKLCDSLKANREPKSATSLSMVLSRVSATDYLAPDVGDYTVIATDPSAAGSYAYATFNRTDSNCTPTLADNASAGKSGVIKVQNLKGEANGNASGNFDITFGGGDKVTGNFSASYCDISTIPVNPNCE